MFIIKKLLTPFLVPPGTFVTLAFCMAVFQFRKNRKQALVWTGFALLLWAFSLRPVGNRVLAGIEYAYLPPAEVNSSASQRPGQNAGPKADVIIVLSAGVLEGASESFGGPALTGVSLERAVEAVRLYRRYKLPLIVTGGAVFSKGSEAAAIKTYLISLGVPEKAILTEERARDTWENAVFSKKICDEKGYARPLVVTSAYHMRRAVLSFEKAGFVNAVPYPTAYRSSRSPDYHYVDFLPCSFESLSLAAHEYLGLVFYKIAYRAEP